MFGNRGHELKENYEAEGISFTSTPFLTLPSGPLYLAYAAITGNHTSNTHGKNQFAHANKPK